MAHYAFLDENNIVLNVVVGPEEDGSIDWEQYYTDIGFAHSVKRTSYNTKGGIHELGDTPFRMNYAEIGGTYDEERDAFIPPKFFKAWVLDENTCMWVPPFDYPDDGNEYVWDDDTDSWIFYE